MSAPRRQVTITVDGAPLIVDAGTTLAAALLNGGHAAWRTSVTGQPRGPLCGMGICYECRVTVDGVAHRRACMLDVAPGMDVRRG